MKFTKVDIERLEYITECIGIKNMDEFEKFLARGFDLDQRWEFLGRPKTIIEEQEAEVLRMKAAGQTIAAIAAAVKISGSSVKNIIRAYRDKLPTHA
jgi:DNA-binding NarL/FixJ family response regulator